MGNTALPRNKQHEPQQLANMILKSFKMIEVLRNHVIGKLKISEKEIVEVLSKKNITKQQYEQYG